MKPEIKRTKQPDGLIHEGKKIRLNADKQGFYVYSRKFGVWKIFTLSEAKELAEVLPKFLEEMEK